MNKVINWIASQLKKLNPWRRSDQTAKNFKESKDVLDSL